MILNTFLVSHGRRFRVIQLLLYYIILLTDHKWTHDFYFEPITFFDNTSRFKKYRYRYKQLAWPPRQWALMQLLEPMSCLYNILKIAFIHNKVG